MTFAIRGCVTTGQGQGKIFVNYDWVQNQIQAKFGFTPYPGTFNLLLDSAEKSSFQLYKKTHDGILIRSGQEECEGLCYKIRINTIIGIIVIPQIPGYPNNQLEIVAPVNLRKALCLRDGDELEVFFY
ncbi:MAG: CTP-dependent riboflavin kinase [Candidatus Bathyarchaeota archaeon]|jgi:CTP-dependent riboflavin kinase|nr:CTP-dependent riboflavin kinase [Candidatus Bathyarchaeota archaeon]